MGWSLLMNRFREPEAGEVRNVPMNEMSLKMEEYRRWHVGLSKVKSDSKECNQARNTAHA